MYITNISSLLVFLELIIHAPTKSIVGTVDVMIDRSKEVDTIELRIDKRTPPPRDTDNDSKLRSLR